uniref:Uncharacterized protein n=1 Tax=Strigamia maritima TaxID=126957 RepID=T1JNY9_STRMM
MYEPTTTSIDIIRSSIVQFPTVTICGESSGIHKLKKKANGNSVLGCEKISHLQLIDYKPADYVWNKLSIHSVVNIGDTVKLYTGVSLKFNETKSEVLLLYGKCTQLETKPIKYVGPTTGLTLQLFPLIKFTFCDKHTFWYILNSPDENIDLSMARDISGTTRSIMYIRIKKVTRLNIARRSCVNKKINLDCMQQCLQRKLQAQLSCRYVTSEH